MPVSISNRTTAERPDIGAPIDSLSPRLLGGHVGGRPEYDALARGAETQRRRVRLILGGGFVAERLGEPEVQNLDAAFLCQLDVARLQVAVNDPVLVRVLQRLGDLAGDPNTVIQFQSAWGPTSLTAPGPHPRRCGLKAATHSQN